MVVVIFFNMVVLMVETDDQSEEKSLVLNWIHLILVAIFLVEFILKIIALRQHYFRNVLHIVDFVVLTLSIIGLFLADILEKYFGSPSLFSVMRLGRLFTLCGAFPHIRFARRIWMLIMGFVMSLPALFNIGLLFFLIVYTFSIIGMFNFAYVKHEMMIDDMFNFKTFGNSIINCDLRLPEPGNCANPTVGIVFFSSYILLFCLLVIHLFIVVILELFNTASPEDAEMLSDDHLQMFYETWRRFDPSGSQVIQYSELADFCDGLQDPLRIPKPNTIKLTHLNLPLFPGDQISCLDVLRTITTQVRSPGTGCQHFDMIHSQVLFYSILFYSILFYILVNFKNTSLQQIFCNRLMRENKLKVRASGLILFSMKKIVVSNFSAGLLKHFSDYSLDYLHLRILILFKLFFKNTFRHAFSRICCFPKPRPHPSEDPAFVGYVGLVLRRPVSWK
uniref:Sodium channel protein n=1 Tax=Maylandia zebra TaxID=106582 RepID=A0A3P9AR79_9CICH